MKKPRSIAWLVLAAATALVPFAAVRADDSDAERIDVLAEEIRKIKENMAIPETDAEMTSYGGLGPAASKVYRVTSGLSLGGYGEFYYQAPTRNTGAVATGDFYRFIAYIGYKFSPRILMNTELEYEHATTSKNHADKAGSVSVEFSYLDFLLSEPANIRTGILLMPVGIVNEMHEPPFYRGSFRPTVEQTVIPSTWRELGAGIHGQPGDTVNYKVYLVNGLNGAEFTTKGIRDGRQKGNRVLFEDIGVVGSVAWDATRVILLGGSAYVGNSGQGQVFDGKTPSVRTVVAEAHAIVRHRGLELRGLVATNTIGDADLLTAEAGEVIPERQLGYYLEASYDIGGTVGLPDDQALLPWVRWEQIDLHAEVPAGSMSDPALDTKQVTVGLEYKPNPSVVIKSDWTWLDNAAGTPTPDPFRLGAGFVF